MPTSSVDFFHLSPLPMWISDVDSNLFLEVNEAAICFYGYDREAFLKMTLKDIQAPGGVKTFDRDVKMHHKKSGAIVYVRLTQNTVPFKDKEANLFLVSDLTEHIEIERKMQQSVERFNIVSKATSDIIWDYSLQSGKVVWNRGIKGVFGHKNIVDHTTTRDWWHSLVHPDDQQRVMSKIKVNLRDKISRWQDEYRFQCGDGSYRYVLDRGFLVFDEMGKPIKMIGAMQDVTKRKESLQAIEEQNKKFKEIAWIHSHMVRAPLARIMALVDLIKTGQPDEDHEVLLDYLSKSANELDRVIVNIADKTPGL